MAVNVTAENFAEIIQGYLKDFGDECSDVMEEVIPEVAKEAAKKLRRSSPKRKGTYAKGWTSKTQPSLTGVSAVVYGKSGTYQLAHLLEFGHAKRNGGRVPGKAHIAPIEEWAIEEAAERITEKIGASG